MQKEPIKLTSGIISPPFGKARLLVTKFITSLISLNNVEINTEIIRCDIPELLLVRRVFEFGKTTRERVELTLVSSVQDLFYAYSSNNFLHTELEKLIAYVIDNLNANYKSTNSSDDLLMMNVSRKFR